MAALLVISMLDTIAVASGDEDQGSGSATGINQTITVTGNAAISMAPDLATIQFGVETQERSASEALTANANLMDQVVNAIKVLGLSDEEISTSRFNIQAVYESHRDRQTGSHSQVLAGYRVSNIVKVETGQLDSVAEIIDASVKAGANRIERVYFSLSPEVHARLKDSLIEAAVLNARSKAEQALAPLEYRIIGVQDMTLTDFSAPVPMYADAGRMEMARSAPTQIFSSGQDVKTTVNVTFLIGAK